MNKSRLQKTNLTALILLVISYLYIVTLCALIKSSVDFFIQVMAGYSALCLFAGSALVTTNTRYAARETMLSKSSPSTVIKMMGDKSEVTK